MTAYHAGIDELDIKWHGQWKSYAFWQYVPTPCMAQSPWSKKKGGGEVTLSPHFLSLGIYICVVMLLVKFSHLYMYVAITMFIVNVARS